MLSQVGPKQVEPELELTILLPCLNEAETLAACIRKANSFLAANGITGEIVVADNGSTDGSMRIAADLGARVVGVAERGYGAALLGGIEAARGRFVVMGDADDSFDFTNLGLFLDKLRRGADIVIGNRFARGIAPGAMPFVHKYLGNPVSCGQRCQSISVRLLVLPRALARNCHCVDPRCAPRSWSASPTRTGLRKGHLLQ